MTFKVGQKVSWSEAGIDYFSSYYPSLRSQLKKDQGTITKIVEGFIYVFWNGLAEEYKAEDWAIKHSEMVN